MYRIARTKACRDIRHSKKTSWRNSVSKLNYQTSVKSGWNRIIKIKGKVCSNTVLHLSVNDRYVTSHRYIANALANNLSHNFSSALSTDTFTLVRNKAEKKNLNFSYISLSNIYILICLSVYICIYLSISYLTYIYIYIYMFFNVLTCWLSIRSSIASGHSR